MVCQILTIFFLNTNLGTINTRNINIVISINISIMNNKYPDGWHGQVLTYPWRIIINLKLADIIAPVSTGGCTPICTNTPLLLYPSTYLPIYSFSFFSSLCAVVPAAKPKIFRSSSSVALLRCSLTYSALIT